MAKSPGKNAKVSWGATTKVVGIGTWNMPGIQTDLLESTEMGDEWKQFLAGLKDGGEISFEGLFDPADGGQTDLRTANLLGSQLTTLRFYVNSVSYYVPTTTNPTSYMLITGWSVAADKADLIKATFTAKVSGAMELL